MAIILTTRYRSTKCPFHAQNATCLLTNGIAVAMIWPRVSNFAKYEQIHPNASGMLAPRGSFTNRKQSDYSSNWNGIFRLMPNSLIRLCGGFNAPNTFEWFSDFNFQLFFPHFNIALSILFAWNSTQMKWFIPIWISYFRLCAKLAQPIRNACMRTGKKMDPSIFRSITFSNLDI